MIGTPEKPLSELGKLSYLSYWKFKIYQYIKKRMNRKGDLKEGKDGGIISIKEISAETSINVNDIISTMQWANMICSEGPR